MTSQHCRHIKEDGFFCQAPALRGRDYCHHHLRSLGRRMRMARALARREPYRIVLPLLDDMNAVLVANMQVLDALSAGLVEDKRARLMLYGLRQVAINLRSLRAAPCLAVPEGQEGTGIRVEDYPGFEEEFGLPPDLDLNKPPEVVFPAAAAAPTVAPATGQAAEQSAYRSNPWQQVNREDVELEEILLTQGQEAYDKRREQLESKAWKQIDRERQKVAEARQTVEAARRNGSQWSSAKLKEHYERLWAAADAQHQADREEIAAVRAQAAKKSPESAPGDDQAKAASDPPAKSGTE